MTNQPDMFERLPNARQRMRFDGKTYDHKRDAVRLKGQMLDVYTAMSDGLWWTLSGISKATGHPEASVSARLRDLRKDRFGAHDVKAEFVRKGMHRYRLVVEK